jgi:hypothetical protein
MPLFNIHQKEHRAKQIVAVISLLNRGLWHVVCRERERERSHWQLGIKITNALSCAKVGCRDIASNASAPSYYYFSIFPKNLIG